MGGMTKYKILRSKRDKSKSKNTMASSERLSSVKDFSQE